MAKQIRYSEDFKRKAVSTYLQGELSCNQISQEFHVHPNTLSAWIHQFKNSSILVTSTPTKDINVKIQMPINLDIDAIFSTLAGIEAQVATLKKLIADYQINAM